MLNDRHILLNGNLETAEDIEQLITAMRRSILELEAQNEKLRNELTALWSIGTSRYTGNTSFHPSISTTTGTPTIRGESISSGRIISSGRLLLDDIVPK